MNFISIEELEKNFLDEEYDLFLRRLEKKSLIKDFSLVFEGKALIFDSACKSFLSDKNLHAVEKFCQLVKEKMKKEFVQNSDKSLVSKTVSDIIQCLVCDISNLSNEGGNFILYKSVGAVKEITKLCVTYKELCINYNVKCTDHTQLWLLRFSEDNWENGAKAILDTYEKLFINAENIKKESFYASEFCTNYNNYLSRKSSSDCEKILDKIISDFNKTKFGFGKDCGLRCSELLINPVEKSVQKLLDKGLPIYKIGSLGFWVNNFDVVKKIIPEMKDKEVVTFYENIKESARKSVFIKKEEIRNVEKICESKLLYDNLTTSLNHEGSVKNKKIKI